MNNYKTTGIWRAAGQVSNMPNTTCYWGTLLVFKSDNYIQQLYIQNYSTAAGRMFVRTCHETFEAWEKVC